MTPQHRQRSGGATAMAHILTRTRGLLRPRPHRHKRVAAATLVCLVWLAISSAYASGAQDQPAQPLQLIVSSATATVTEPLPVRLTLHFHNSASQAIWLYKPARDATTISQTPLGRSPGGSTLVVDASPEGEPNASTADCTLLQGANLPQPQLVSLPPGGDVVETIPVHISPGTAKGTGGSTPIWGPYQLSVRYSASYSNGDAISQELGVNVWQGSVTSNSVRLQLEPAPPENRGWITGEILSRRQQQAWGVLVTLSDWSEHVLSQKVTGTDGGFTFGHLPFGRYWVTIRRLGENQQTGLFEHADISDAQPGATLKLILLDTEDYRARELLHKPVLLRVTDSEGRPLSDTELAILWTSGTVMQNLKIRTGEDGLAETGLIPGSNYITLRHRGCRKTDQAIDVPSGSGIAGFNLTMPCKE